VGGGGRSQVKKDTKKKAVDGAWRNGDVKWCTIYKRTSLCKKNKTSVAGKNAAAWYNCEAPNLYSGDGSTGSDLGPITGYPGTHTMVSS